MILRAFGPAFRLACHQGTDFQLPTSPMSSIAPRAMSLSRPRPRHMMMLPGGWPFAHARKPTSLAILIRYRENYPAEPEWPAGSGAWQSRIHVTSLARTRDAPGSGLIRLSIVNRNSRQPEMQSIASNRTSRQRFAVAPAMRAIEFRPAWSLKCSRISPVQSASSQVVASVFRFDCRQPKRQPLGGLAPARETRLSTAC